MDVPAPSARSMNSCPPVEPLGSMVSPPPPLPVDPFTPPVFPCGGTTTIPLQLAPNQHLVLPQDIAMAIRIVSTCIDICMAMLAVYITSTEASEAHIRHRKKLKRSDSDDISVAPSRTLRRHDDNEATLPHPHVKQVVGPVAWHIGVENARWYVKPRSTCWFEEYLFNIYTPDMFYDILRMRRRTFGRLVEDLCPHIQGQFTKWRQPIGVEKKVVVTFVKLMHGVSIPLVADKAALGNTTRKQWSN